MNCALLKFLDENRVNVFAIYLSLNYFEKNSSYVSGVSVCIFVALSAGLDVCCRGQ